MINYITGKIAELSPASVVIDNHGIGYQIHISLNTYSFLENKSEATIYIYEAIREDAYQLFGFLNKEERDLFLLLISVSGIGAGTARMILSSMTTTELSTIISTGNSDMLKTVKGIGLKTAQRIIIDLKDKIKGYQSDLGTSTVSSTLASESVAALVMLGFAQVPSQKVVAKILKDNPQSTIEQVIKMALKML